MAHGRRKSDHARIFCVPSQTEHNRWHILVLVGDRIVCDCRAAQHGKICAHRAAVHLELAREIAARLEQNRRAAKALRAEAEAERMAVRAASTGYSREVPRLANDRRAVSIFK